MRGEIWLGLELGFIGMGVVLITLLALALLIRLLRGLGGAEGGPAEEEAPRVWETQVWDGEAPDPAAASGLPPGEVVAAIAGALAVCLDGGDHRARLLQVRALEPAGGPSPWALAGRTEQMRSRQLERRSRGGTGRS